MKHLTPEGELLILLARTCREHMHDYLQARPINRRAFAATCDKIDALLLRLEESTDSSTAPTALPAILPSHKK